MKVFVFPRWANKTRQLAGIALGVTPLYLIGLVWYGASPKTTDVGYMPKQPVPYSHALHAGQLGLDCRYCHNTVEKAAVAAIPATATCMNCHGKVHTQSPALAPVRESYESGRPVEWVKVHDLPDYAYFNHSAHVNHGVGCVECHGRIDRMDVVHQEKPLSMGWCLECHREPEKHLRPRDQITNMDWKPAGDVLAALAQGLELKTSYGLHDQSYMISSYTCHR
jgi:hypothetical protein